MIADFLRALASVQSDYGFYIGCQTNPAAALSEYSLTPDERQTLLDPEKLSNALDEGVLDSKPREWRIVITITGRHDWINTTKPSRRDVVEDAAGRDARIAHEIRSIRGADTPEERKAAAVALMGLIG